MTFKERLKQHPLWWLILALILVNLGIWSGGLRIALESLGWL